MHSTLKMWVVQKSIHIHGLPLHICNQKVWEAEQLYGHCDKDINLFITITKMTISSRVGFFLRKI